MCDNYVEGTCLSWGSSTPCEECRTVAEAMALVGPHLERMHREYGALSRYADLVVMIPRGWPASFDGATLLGLPVVREDVDEPKVGRSHG